MSARVRVARVITRLNVGGPAIQAMLLSTRLNASRYETLLLSGRLGPREGDMLALRPADGLRRRTVGGLGREIAPAADVRAFAEIVAVLRDYRPHIVHTHMAKAGLLGRLAARLVGVPIVVHTFHGNVLRGYFPGWQSHALLHLERLLARLSTRVISISPLQSDELRRLRIGEDSRLVEVPIGLDLGPFLDPPRGRFRAELALGHEVPLVGIVGRLVAIKGVDVYLAGAEHLARRRHDVHFVVLGDGELREELAVLARELGIADRTHFLGWRADMPSFYADLDVVTLTSHNEGTPVSLIEALAARRAVAATAVGGVPDLLGSGSCGVLVGDGDAQGLADAVAELLDRPERRAELGDAGRARVYPGYDVSTLVRRIDDLYRQLLFDHARVST